MFEGIVQLTGKTGYIVRGDSLLVIYFLSDHEIVMIDSGEFEDPEMIAYFDAQNIRISAVINTHIHVDHVAKEIQKKVLEQALEERGVQFKNSKLKFIGLVSHNTVDESNPFLFLDHAGVIYEKNGSVYLLEKLAFQEPYQWIEFPSEEEIIKYFEAKYNLDTTGKMAKPIYMINDKLF